MDVEHYDIDFHVNGSHKKQQHGTPCRTMSGFFSHILLTQPVKSLLRRGKKKGVEWCEEGVQKLIQFCRRTPNGADLKPFPTVAVSQCGGGQCPLNGRH